MKSFLVLFILPVLPCVTVFCSEVIKEETWPGCAVISINFPYSSRAWLKREPRQVDMGPFWANRGKKDPKYFYSKLYAEEPHWLYIRKDNRSFDNEFDPFFTTRGKKRPAKEVFMGKLLDEIRRRKGVRGFTLR